MPSLSLVPLAHSVFELFHHCNADPEAHAVVVQVQASPFWTAHIRQQQPRPSGRGAVSSRAPEPSFAAVAGGLLAGGVGQLALSLRRVWTQ